jgi:hypothetical protein
MKGVALAAAPLAMAALVAAAGILSSCEPVSVAPGAVPASSAAIPAGGAGGAAAGGGVTAGGPAGASEGGARPVATELLPDDPGRRIDALERALQARDRRIRELEEALVASAEGAQRDVAAERAARDAALRRLEERLSAADLFLASLEKRFEERLAEQARALERAERTVGALRAASPLPNLAADVPKIDGIILSVERQAGAAPPVVLLNVGSRQGVQPSYEFTVQRGGKPFAKVALDRVEGEVSSGRVVYARDGELVRPGDAVSTRP